MRRGYPAPLALRTGTVRIPGARSRTTNRFPHPRDGWYRQLAAAGVVTAGTTSGERMHKARHTAGQRVLDPTGNLKAVQKLLGHSSIATTGDIYADWDIEQLTATLAEVLAADG